MTSNKYMNAFITISNVYYDIYNNGGGNIKDCYLSDIKKYIDPIRRLNKNKLNLKNLDYLEIFTNLFLEKIKKEDFSYEKIVIYIDHDKSTFSKNKILKNSITFGLKEECENYIKNLKYKEI